MVAIHSEVMTKWNSFLMFVAQVMLNLDLSTNYFIIIEFHSLNKYFDCPFKVQITTSDDHNKWNLSK